MGTKLHNNYLDDRLAKGWERREEEEGLAEFHIQ